MVCKKILEVTKVAPCGSTALWIPTTILLTSELKCGFIGVPAQDPPTKDEPPDIRRDLKVTQSLMPHTILCTELTRGVEGPGPIDPSVRPLSMRASHPGRVLRHIRPKGVGPKGRVRRARETLIVT